MNTGAEPRPPARFSKRGRERQRPDAGAVAKRLLTLLLAGVVLYGVAPAILCCGAARPRATSSSSESSPNRARPPARKPGRRGTLALAGVAAAPAALAVLAYRLAAYWLPLPVGLVAWVWRRRSYGTPH